MNRAALLAVGLALAGCSRAGGETQSDTPPLAPSPPSVAVAPDSASAPAPSAAPTTASSAAVTAEDAEEDAAHRITEQNLESELDRLEREIQAE
jgi:hypothetical protein